MPIADAYVTAASGLIGVVVGGGVSWLAQHQGESRRQRAAVRTAARLLYADLRYVIGWIDRTLDRSGGWWLEGEKPSMNAWRNGKDTLAGAEGLSGEDWKQLVGTVSELRWARDRRPAREFASGDVERLGDLRGQLVTSIQTIGRLAGDEAA